MVNFLLASLKESTTPRRLIKVSSIHNGESQAQVFISLLMVLSIWVNGLTTIFMVRVSTSSQTIKDMRVKWLMATWRAKASSII
jgi:hypothetical protein